MDYAINFDQDKYSYDESKYTIKGVSSKEKDNKYNDKYELAKKTEYDESKVTLDNQEKVDGTKRQDKGKIAFAMDKYSDENEITFENNIDSDVKNNTQKSTLNIVIKFAEEPINFILKSNTKLKQILILMLVVLKTSIVYLQKTAKNLKKKSRKMAVKCLNQF